MNKKLFLLVIIIFLMSSAVCQAVDIMAPSQIPENQAVGFGIYSQGEIQLRWSIPVWPEDLLGFDVYRAKATEHNNPDAFKKNNDFIIDPSLTFERVNKLGLPRLEARMREGLVQESPTKRLIIYYSSQDSGLVKTVIQHLWPDFEMMQISGFGYADRGIVIGGEYVYKIVPVYADAAKSKDPIATITVKAESKQLICPILSISAERTEAGNVQMLWSVDTKTLKNLGVFAFKIYGAEGPNPLELISPALLGPDIKKSNDSVSWFGYIDNVNRNGRAFKYALRPVFAYAREGEYSERVFVPRQLPPLPYPKLGKAKLENNEVKLTWEFPFNIEIAGFQVERYYQGKPDDPELLTIEYLPKESREYVDKNPPSEPGKIFYYRIIAVSGDYRLPARSNEFHHIQVPFPPPPIPTEVNIQRKVIDKKAAFQLLWKIEDVKGIKGYKIQQKLPVVPGWQLLEMNVELPIYLINLSNVDSGQLRSYRVITVMNDGRESKPSEEVAETTFSVEDPDPVNVLPLYSKDGNIYITWRYLIQPYIKGFRMYVDSKQIEDETILTPLVREYILWGAPIGKEVEIQITAVDIDGKESKLNKPARVIVSGRIGKSNQIPALPDIDYATAETKHHLSYVTSKKEKIDVEFDYVEAPDGRQVFQGEKKAYFPFGELDSWLNYKEGKMHGVQRWYSLDGNLDMLLLYDSGKLTSKEEYEGKYGELKLSKEEEDVLTKSYQ